MAVGHHGEGTSTEHTYIYKRVSDVDNPFKRGTVVFEGSLEGVSGIWLGIDWDNPAEGKHDGSYKGKRYFTAAAPKSGSFVRATKIRCGLGVMDTMREKYGTEHLVDPHYVVGNRTVEMVGLAESTQRMSKLNRLARLILSGSNVAFAGQERFADLMPNVTEIDLSKTLISSFDDLCLILNQLPKLTTVNLSHNIFTTQVPAEGSCFPRILAVYLHKLSFDWERADTVISTLFPNVVKVGLCGNDIAGIAGQSPTPEEQTTSDHWLASVEELDLESNPLANSDAISCLSSPTLLRVLNLSGCMLTDFRVASRHSYPALETLHLSHNNITDWRVVDRLNGLRSLTHLRIVGNPLQQHHSWKEFRQLVIARLGRLENLDREDVTREERRGAELDYLKKFGGGWLQAKEAGEAQLEEFYAMHPRYAELVEEHGAPQAGEMKMVNPGILKHSLVQLTINCSDTDYSKRLPRSMSVRKLRVLAARLTSNMPRSLRLVYESGEGAVSFELENDMRDLGFYAMRDGDVVRVERVE